MNDMKDIIDRAIAKRAMSLNPDEWTETPDEIRVEIMRQADMVSPQDMPTLARGSYAHERATMILVFDATDPEGEPLRTDVAICGPVSDWHFLDESEYVLTAESTISAPELIDLMSDIWLDIEHPDWTHEDREGFRERAAEIASKVIAPDTKATMRRLTPKEREIHNFVRSRTHLDGISPQTPEIARAARLRSASDATRYLSRIADKGWFEILPERAPIMRRDEPDAPLVYVDRNWSRIEPECNVQGRIPHAIGQRFTPNPDLYLTFGERVAEGIEHGEIVGISTAAPVTAGHTTLVRINGTIRCERVMSLDKDRVVLNMHRLEPYHLAKDDIEILGIVCGLIRTGGVDARGTPLESDDGAAT